MLFTKKSKACLGLLFVLFFTIMITSCGPVEESPKFSSERIAENNVVEALKKVIFAEEDITAITSSVVLTTINKDFPDVTFTWSSSQEDVISPSGKVVRPQADDPRAVHIDKNDENSDLIVNVVLTVSAKANYSYEVDGEIANFETIPVSKSFNFSVKTIAAGTTTGTIKEVKQKAWNFFYVENKVAKTLTTYTEKYFPVLVQGVVTSKLQANGATSGYTIHDGTDGFYVYGANDKIEVGDVVEVIGDVYPYYGSLQIGKNVSAEVVTLQLPIEVGEYKEYTPQSWEDAQKPLEDGTYPDNVVGNFGGNLVKISGYLTNEDAPGGSSDKFCLTDAKTGEKAWIYYKSYTEEMKETLLANVDKYVEIRGASYDRDSRMNKNEILWDGSIEEKAAPVVDDKAKLAVKLAGITLKEEYTENFELSKEGTWEVVSGTGIEIFDGVAKVTLNDAIQEVVLKITVVVGKASGTKQFTITLPADKVEITSLTDAITLCGTTKNKYTTDKYFVKGVIKSIDNTSYGNMTITDGTTDLYIYGVYSKDGVDKYGALKDKPQVGDTILLKGILGYYTAPQMKSGWLFGIEYKTEFETKTFEEAEALVPNVNDTTTEAYSVKGIIKEFTNEKYGNCVIKDLSGKEFVVYGMLDKDGKTNYGSMTENKPVVGDFVVLNGILTNYKGTKELKNGIIKQVNRIVLGEGGHVDEKEPLETDFNTISFDEVTALANAENPDKTTKYYVIGYVKEISNKSYGNMTIEDADGKTMVLYGTYSFDGKLIFNKIPVEIKVNDVIVVYGTITKYNDIVEVVNSWIVQIGKEVQTATPDYILAAVSLDSSVESDFDLPTTVTWTIKSGTGIAIEGSKAVVTKTSEIQNVVLTATATDGKTTKTKDFNITIPAALAEGSVQYDFTISNFTAGTQYADNEEHKLNDVVTIYTTKCHFTKELRIYSSSTNNGFVVSNNLNKAIESMTFNIGYKSDVLLVYGSTDGTNWTVVKEASVTSANTSTYSDVIVDFGDTNYTYFKLDVKGSNQLRIKNFSIVLK